jgi:hypothetical protein
LSIPVSSGVVVVCERCATVLAWATTVAVTSAFDVADPLRITLLPRAPPSRTAVWVAAALLVLLMFSSYALGRRRSQSTPPAGRSRNDRNLQFLTIDHYQPSLRRLCLAFSVDDRTGYGPRPDDGT